MNIADKLLSIKPREESGSKTSKKYSFQTDLSLFLLLRRHEQLEDYVYLFDFHDDLMILDSAESPTNIDFYQIKTKDKGNWTINDLLKSDKDKETKKDLLSILGKLYFNKLNFPDSTRSLNFITNASFSFKHLKSKEDSTKKVEIKATELDQDNLDKCFTKIREEHGINDSSDFETLTNFKVTKLSNADSNTHCLGELSSLVHKLNPDNKVNPQLAYYQIIGEVRRKGNSITSDQDFKDLGELIAVKGISKKQFLEYLEKAGLYKSVEDEWNEVKTQLELSGIKTIELLKYKSAFRDVNMKLISDVNKIPLKKLKSEIESLLVLCEEQNEINSQSSLKDIIETCQSKLAANIFDDYFVKSLIIKVVYEKF